MRVYRLIFVGAPFFLVFASGLACGDQTYHFHAGAPSLDNYLAAVAELTAKIDSRLARSQVGGDVVETPPGALVCVVGL